MTVAVPLSYSVRSAVARWRSTAVAVLGIAGTVAVFVAMLAMAHGFRATLIASGSPRNAIVLRGGADSEMESAINLEHARIIADAPGVARTASGGPLASFEVVVIASFPLASSGTPANVQVRGVGPLALEVRPGIRVARGRFFEPGRAELVIGANVPRSYAGLELGREVRFGGGTWTVVGVLDADGSAFDSEIWGDAQVLNQVYRRPQNIFQSVTAHLASADAFARFKDSLTSDPRLTVAVEREAGYYERKSRLVATMISVLGFLVAAVMAVGAVFAALNTMYSAVAARVREIATLRSLGFGPGGILVAFVVESLLVAGAGGLLGCLAALPFNGFTTGTINWATFAHLAFAFRVTPGIVLTGFLFALAMGAAGGLPAAIRAARLPVATALREL